MPRVLGILLAGAVAASVGGSLPATAGTQPGAVSVHVPRAPSVRANVHVSFRPTTALPAGGYYYAVIVLRPYRHYTRQSPPPCSFSSDMARTDYGYPQASGTVALALTPTHSHTRHWCPGGSYLGAIYAVPQAPPCQSEYPCEAEKLEQPPQCWEADGHLLCGLVIARKPPYKYLDGLPEPAAKGTSVITRFALTFPAHARAAGAGGV
jgi:hypothetical protein